MDPHSSASPGFLSALSGLGENLIGTLHDRVELLALDLHEEKFRVIRIFIWISAIVFTGMLAILFASITLVYLFWDSARLAALGGFTLLYAVAFGVIVVAFRRHLANQARPFAASLRELNTDRACIRTET
ncbi:MAG TPA: phage holin family protein [Opitutaceae bacterium]